MNHLNEENLNNIVKLEVRIVSQLYPKDKRVNKNEFGIFLCLITKIIDSEEDIDFLHFEEVRIKGIWQNINLNEYYKVTAKLIDHEKYGIQFDLIFVSKSIDLTTEEKQKIFISKIVTKRQLKSLYHTYENPFVYIEKGDISALCEVKGIGEVTASKIIDRYMETVDFADILIELANYGITQTIAIKLLNHYKSPDMVIKKVKENVYLLAKEVDGIGFKTADQLALYNGMDPHDPRRIEAYIYYLLSEEAEKGNSWIYTETLFKNIYESCGRNLDKKIIQSVLRNLLETETIWTSERRNRIALKYYYFLERKIYKEIKRLSNISFHQPHEHWLEVIKEIEKEQGWCYSDNQKDSVQKILEYPVVIVTGLAGTGKSTITNVVIKILKQYKLIQCALSGRASQRMKELNHCESNTIHKTLGYMKGEWTYDEENPLDVDIFILDEASMVNGYIFLKILKALITGTKLIIIGDYGQLPAIGNCNVFMDLIENGMIPTVKLTEVHRQAQDSAIISKSIDVRNQIQLFDKDFEGEKILGKSNDLNMIIYKDSSRIKDKVIEKFLFHYQDLNKDLMKIQIVTAMKKRGAICTFELNNAIQHLIHEADNEECLVIDEDLRFYVGDKVINTKNKEVASFTEKENKVQIFNGNIGIIKIIRLDLNIMVVDFGESIGMVLLEYEEVKDSIDLAYAITCHKLQGSSAERAIVTLDSSAYTLLSCEWLYTAITRGEKFVELIGENKAIRYAISNPVNTQKQTFLKNLEDFE